MFQWETRLAELPTGTLGLRVLIFLSTLNTYDVFYFLHTTQFYNNNNTIGDVLYNFLMSSLYYDAQA